MDVLSDHLGRGAVLGTTPPILSGVTQELAQETNPLDLIPPAVLSELSEREPQLVDDLTNGSLTEIPDSVVDRLPTDLVNQIPTELLGGVDPVFLAIIAGVALLALAGFFYGVMKAAIKAAVFFGLVAAVAGYLFFSLS